MSRLGENRRGDAYVVDDGPTAASYFMVRFDPASGKWTVTSCARPFNPNAHKVVYCG